MKVGVQEERKSLEPDSDQHCFYRYILQRMALQGHTHTPPPPSGAEDKDKLKLMKSSFQKIKEL